MPTLTRSCHNSCCLPYASSQAIDSTGHNWRTHAVGGHWLSRLFRPFVQQMRFADKSSIIFAVTIHATRRSFVRRLSCCPESCDHFALAANGLRMCTEKKTEDGWSNDVVPATAVQTDKLTHSFTRQSSFAGATYNCFQAVAACVWHITMMLMMICDRRNINGQRIRTPH